MGVMKRLLERRMFGVPAEADATVQRHIREHLALIELSERKTPERMGRPGDMNKQTTGKSSHIGGTCQER